MPTLEYYNKVLEINPNDYLSLNNKAWLLIEKKEYNNALQDINKALQLNSNDGFVSDTKGFILFKMKKYEEAIIFFEKALSINENSIRWLHKAQAHYQLEQFKKALDCYNNAIKLDKNNRDALYGLACTKFKLGMQQEGLKILEKLTVIDDGYKKRAIKEGIVKE